MRLADARVRHTLRALLIALGRLPGLRDVAMCGSRAPASSTAPAPAVPGDNHVQAAAHRNGVSAADAFDSVPSVRCASPTANASSAWLAEGGLSDMGRGSIQAAGARA